jgi:hypothetical protein
MVATWIATRSADEVDEYAGSSLAALVSLGEEDDAFADQLEAARLELWRALDAGSISATAHDEQNQSVRLPSDAWRDLTIKSDDPRDFEFGAGTTLCHDGAGPYFREVSFRSSDVRKLWPSPEMAETLQALESHSTLIAASDPASEVVEVAQAAPEQPITLIAEAGSPKTIQEIIREQGGPARLTPKRRNIYDAIVSAGGLATLPHGIEAKMEYLKPHIKGGEKSNSKRSTYYEFFKELGLNSPTLSEFVQK